MRRLHLVFAMVCAVSMSMAAGSAASKSAAQHRKAGTVFRNCPTCPEMVVIPPGSFIMGSPGTEKGRDSDEIQHKVTIAYSFAVSKYPIT